MPVFFTNNNDEAQVGRTIGFADPHTQGTTTLIQLDPKLTWTTERSIITRLTLSQQCNFQFLHTIGNDIYVYVFGDRIGQMTISGLSMAHDCDQRDSEHGFEKIIKWYKQNRLTRRRDPIKITIGKTPIQGFLVAMSGDIVDPSTRLVQYSMTLSVLPEKT